MKPNPTAIDLVTLVRRHRALGGFSGLDLRAEDAPDVLALIEQIAEREPEAWQPPREKVPAIYTVEVEETRIEIWGMPQPSTYVDVVDHVKRFGAQVRAGALLVEMAESKQARRAGRRAA